MVSAIFRHKRAEKSTRHLRVLLGTSYGVRTRASRLRILRVNHFTNEANYQRKSFYHISPKLVNCFVKKSPALHPILFQSKSALPLLKSADCRRPRGQICEKSKGKALSFKPEKGTLLILLPNEPHHFSKCP